MFSDITFQNSFLSFPASWWCFLQLRERVSALSVLPVAFRSVTPDTEVTFTSNPKVCKSLETLPGAQTVPSLSAPAGGGPGTEGIHKFHFPLYLLDRDVWLEKFSAELGEFKKVETHGVKWENSCIDMHHWLLLETLRSPNEFCLEQGKTAITLVWCDISFLSCFRSSSQRTHLSFSQETNQDISPRDDKYLRFGLQFCAGGSQSPLNATKHNWRLSKKEVG